MSVGPSWHSYLNIIPEASCYGQIQRPFRCRPVLQRYHGEDVEASEALDLMEAPGWRNAKNLRLYDKLYEKWMRNGSFKKNLL